MAKLSKLLWIEVLITVVIAAVLVGLKISKAPQAMKKPEIAREEKSALAAAESLKEIPVFRDLLDENSELAEFIKNRSALITVEDVEFFKHNPEFIEYLRKNPEITKMIINDPAPRDKTGDVFKKFIEQKNR